MNQKTMLYLPAGKVSDVKASLVKIDTDKQSNPYFVTADVLAKMEPERPKPYMERVEIGHNLHDDNVRYTFYCNDNGHILGLEYNEAASGNLYPGMIAGGIVVVQEKLVYIDGEPDFVIEDFDARKLASILKLCDVDTDQIVETVEV